MMLIDQRFLSPHPRTVLWQEHERKQCLTCAHLRQPMANKVRETKNAPAWMRCAAAKSSCIDAREPGGRCGPNGVLWRQA